ncbi:MAG: DUF481 domain-containing protein [Planctomycetota bacterium]
MKSLSLPSATTAAVACSLTAFAAVSAHAGTVTLTNEDVVTGTITAQTDDAVTVEHPDLGTLNIDKANVEGVTLEKTDPIYQITENVPPPWGWGKSLEIGVNGSDGNTDSLSVSSIFSTGYENDFHRINFRARIFYGEEDGINTRNEWDAAVLKDWIEPENPTFYWASATYEHDRFTGWQDRISGFGGVGSDLIKRDDYVMRGRLGVGANYEFGQINETTPELFLSLEGKWTLDAKSTLEWYTQFYPSLDPAFSEFRNISGINLTTEIDRGKGLALKIGAENEYDSDVAPGTEENDLKYYARIVYSF